MANRASLGPGVRVALPREGRRVLLLAAVVVVAAYVLILLGVGPPWARLLDNIHWTTAYVSAAILAWMGTRAEAGEDLRARRWFAWGLSAYAGGQVLWDIQVALGWNPFPGPSDALFLCLGPCCALGLLSSLRVRGRGNDRRTVLMDAVGLVVVVLVVALALYLPRRGTTSSWELTVLVAYPVGMLAAASLGVVLVPILRLRLDWGSGFLLGALLVNGFLWMRWNALTLDRALTDGSLYNFCFSVTALALGTGALGWRVVVSTEPAWERKCEWSLRLLPLLLVGGSALAVALVVTLPDVPAPVRLSVEVGALISVALAFARQSLLLSEREHLLRVERELRESELKFSAFRELIIHHATEGLCVWHELPEFPFVRFTAWNQRMREITGYTQEEINRLGWYETIYPDPEERAVAREHLRRIREGDNSRGEEWLVTCAGGTKRTLRINTTLIRGGDGLAQVLALLDDVTERKQAEQLKRELDTHLRHAQKMEALGTLAGGVAHDFNNILGTILGNVALARQDVGDNESALMSLAEISKASHRAKNLVKQILAFSRTAEVRPQSVIQLGPVVEEAVTLLRASIPAGIELRFRVAPDTPNVRADANQIHQVLVNLCTNSWHALPHGKGCIEILAAPYVLEPGATPPAGQLPPGRYACLSVVDDGVGMSEGILERIFEPFFTTKELGQGTGLGLAVVHGIVRSHHGGITVRSQPGLGSTIAIYLPSVDAVAEPPRAESTALAQGRGQRLLYVDDEEGLVLLATRLFERLNYRVTGCTRAGDALAKLKGAPEQFDLVVTDYNMPGMSGLELARNVRALRPTLPVVLTSGYVNDELKARAREAGVAHLVYKPNTVEELCDAVNRVVGSAVNAGPQP